MILVDTADLYFRFKRQYNGTLQYGPFFDWMVDVHGQMDRIVYIADHGNSDGFIKYFSHVENTRVVIKCPRNDICCFDTELIVDALDHEYDKLIICSASIELLPLFQLLKREQVPLFLYSCGIPKVFENYAHVMEIDERYVRKAQQEVDRR